MRILYFSKDYTPHDHRFLSALAETEHKVFYLRLERGPRQTEDRPVPSKIAQVLWAGGQRPFRWRDIPQLVISMRRVLRETNPDLIHAGPIQTCAFLAVLSNFRPLLTMSWGFDLMQDAERNGWWRWITRYVLRRSTFFTSDCDVTRKKAVAFGMNPERTIVFPWGVDLGHFCPPPLRAKKRRSPIGGRSFTVFCNRSWEPRYGVDVLARAFVEVAYRNPSVNLILLGGGSQGNAIRQIFEKAGVSQRIIFGGQVSQADLPRYYHMADLFVSPSHVDGSSVSLMEALACGLPVLVSDIPANKEWVVDGYNGWLFPDGEHKALAKTIMSIMEDRSRLKKISQSARDTAEKRANWKENFARLLHAYVLTAEYSKN